MNKDEECTFNHYNEEHQKRETDLTKRLLFWEGLLSSNRISNATFDNELDSIQRDMNELFMDVVCVHKEVNRAIKRSGEWCLSLERIVARTEMALKELGHL